MQLYVAMVVIASPSLEQIARLAIFGNFMTFLSQFARPGSLDDDHEQSPRHEAWYTLRQCRRPAQRYVSLWHACTAHAQQATNALPQLTPHLSSQRIHSSHHSTHTAQSTAHTTAHIMDRTQRKPQLTPQLTHSFYSSHHSSHTAYVQLTPQLTS